MVRKQGIAVYEVQLTLAWMRETPPKLLNILSRVQAKQAIEPFLNRIILTVPDRLI